MHIEGFCNVKSYHNIIAPLCTDGLASYVVHIMYILESVVKDLEIQDDDDDVNDLPILDAQALVSEEEKSQQVEVHVLQSGQINFAAPSKCADAECCNSDTEISHDKDSATKDVGNISSASIDNYDQKQEDHTSLVSEEQHVSPSKRTTSLDKSEQAINLQPPSVNPHPNTTMNSHVQPPLCSTSMAQIPQPSAIKEPPLIIRRNCTSRHHIASVAKIDQSTSQLSSRVASTSTTALDTDAPSAKTTTLPTALDTETTDKSQKQVRRSSRLSLRTNNIGESTSRNEAYKLRRKQKLSSSSTSPPSAKRSRHSEVSSTSPMVHSELDKNESNPMNWGIEEVVQFISSVPRCDYAQVFREHVSQSIIVKKYISQPVCVQKHEHWQWLLYLINTPTSKHTNYALQLLRHLDQINCQEGSSRQP